MNGRRVIRTSLVRLIACVILGLVTTFAVSAGLAVFLPHSDLKHLMQLNSVVGDFKQPPIVVERYFRSGMERRAWLVQLFGASYSHTSDFFGFRGKFEWIESEGVSLPQTALWGHLRKAVTDRPVNATWVIEDARGWPFLAFWCSIETGDGRDARKPLGTNGGLSLSRTDGSIPVPDFRCVPLRPIWRGVVLNSAFYAGLWLVPIGVVPLVRAGRRRRRGLCPTCAYDLLGDLAEGCPECGWGKDRAAGGTGRA